MLGASHLLHAALDTATSNIDTIGFHRFDVQMIDFRNISSDDPILGQSPLVRALDFLAAKFDEYPQGIPLTKSLFFKRDLIAGAIVEIQWPDWTEQQIFHGYMPIKVADEHHFEPFRDLHHQCPSSGFLGPKAA